jgi:hypothetical protein
MRDTRRKILRDFQTIKPSDDDAKTTFEFANWNEFEFDGFKMPGTKDAYADCQEFKSIGCLNKRA